VDGYGPREARCLLAGGARDLVIEGVGESPRSLWAGYVSLCENYPAQNCLVKRKPSSSRGYAAIDSGAGVAGSGSVSACAWAAAGLGPIITNATIAPTRATTAPTRRPSLSA
jgi:hypothetical protein